MMGCHARRLRRLVAFTFNKLINWCRLKNIEEQCGAALKFLSPPVKTKSYSNVEKRKLLK